MGKNERAFQKLKHWRKLLQDTPALVATTSQAMAKATLGLIDEGWEKQRDPYGNRWAPKKVPDGRPVLVGKTKRLRRWRIVRAGRTGFQVAPIVDYAAPHQEPRRGRRPARRMVPAKRRGLPSRWRNVLKRVSREQMKKHFARKR